MPSCDVTWLHISDAHFGAPDMTGALDSVIAMLLDDLQRMRSERSLVPDFLFFTGDIAFGELPHSQLADQYLAAQELLSKIEELFQLPRLNMFLVPGNHDVNRTRVDEPQTSWLDSLLQGGADPTLAVDQLWSKPENVSRDRYLERLENYAAFIQRAGLRHLLQDRKRLVYTHRRRVRGVDIAITGLNTAWSSSRDRERGKLWLGQSQVNANAQVARNADLSIALGHHPPGWFNEYEDPAWYQALSTHYDFYLHGHEHDDWVDERSEHVRVASGALYERRLTTTGYNFVRLDFDQPRAEVFLRQYDTRGGGWIPRCIYGKTDDSGRWALSYRPQARRRSSRTLDTVVSPPAPVPAPNIDVFEYFAVATAVSDESRFIGRRNELRTALSALRARGAAIAIYGLAGVGKTSLALQIARIANGTDTKLCTAPALAGCAPAAGFSHQVVYYSCRQAIDVNLEATLQSLLQDRTGDFHMGRLLALDGFREACRKAGVDSMLDAWQRNDGAVPPSALNLFRSLGSVAYDFLGKRELVVVLDEFNVVADKSGFATLLKELPQVKFVLVGTAVDVRLLVQDHASIPRQLAEGQIRLRPMSVDELIDLISNEEARSQNAFAFSAQAKRDVASAARGMPFFAHFLGRYSLEAASRDNTNERSVKVELSHVQRALSERLTDLGDLEGEYVRVVNGRWEREVLLKLLSSRDEDSIPLINLRAAAAQLGVRRLDSAVQSFVKNGVMNRVAEAMYQFNDTRLMVYARLRAPLTDEARKRWCHHESTRIAAS
ncbi:MAG: hypothetical protein RL685_2726 [Pseudomonadota bacterium]